MQAREASTTLKAIVAAIFAAAVAGTWVFASQRLPPYILPPPGEIFRAAADFFGSSRQLGHLSMTLFHIGASIAIAFVLGAALALAAHYASWISPTIHRRISPFLNSFSGVGWTLLAVIWFGVSSTSVIFAISIVLLPFALINLREGLLALDVELDEMGMSFTRDRERLFLLIVLPELLPFATATLRIMFGVAWKVALTAELFGGSGGLGYLINLARQEFDMAMILTVILFIILAVYLADRFIFAPMERHTARRFGAASR